MNTNGQMSLFWILSLALVSVQSRPLRDVTLRPLDVATNRELFLSALQSYFSSRGIHIDQTAPAFFMFSTKKHNTRSIEREGLGMTGEGMDLLDPLRIQQVYLLIEGMLRESKLCTQACV